MIKWTSLKVILLPAIIEEVDRVTESFISEFEFDIDVVAECKANSDGKSIKKFLQMRDSVSFD